VYFVSVILLLLVLPVVSVVTEATLFPHGAGTMALVGRWFCFWGCGVRLFLAGVRQVIQPRFTAEDIFGIRDAKALGIVRELGFANLSMGLLGLLSVAQREWVVPAAVVGGLYYGLACGGHFAKAERNPKEWMAMLSDAFIFIVLAIFVVTSFV